jgi:hypothetical protein
MDRSGEFPPFIEHAREYGLADARVLSAANLAAPKRMKPASACWMNWLV